MPGGAPCLQCSLRWHGYVALGLGGCTWCLANRRVSVAMVETEHVEQGHDDTGTIGDHDAVFAWGNWRACLTTLQQARLIVMRGHLRDISHAPPDLRRQLRFSGDSDWDWAVPTSSGLWVPDPRWSDDA